MSVLVYIQNFNGKLKKQNLELAGYAAKIGEKTGLSVTGVVLGQIDDNELQKLSGFGVSKVLKFDDERLNVRVNKFFTQAIEAAAQKVNAEIVLFPDNNTGKALAPRLSVKLKAGFVPGVTALPENHDPFIVTKRAFSGKAFAKVKVKSDIKILSLMNNSFGLHEKPVELSIEAFNADINFDDSPTQIVDRQVSDKAVSLVDAEIVVSGGRGMKGPENWQPLEELAEALGAATACSRPVSDEGWRPHEEHVGQTGKVIAPNLYFAIGISGAIQHVAGVSGSKYLVAINNDDEAPIFQVADYGIVGDAHKILPKLTKVVKKFKEE